MILEDESSFGVWIGYFALEEDEYALSTAEFSARFTQFRAAVRECVLGFPLARGLLVRELGHALYLEFAEGDQLEDPIGWIKLVRARLNALRLASVGVLSHGARWLCDEPESVPQIDGIKWLDPALPSEALRRALYADTASHPDDEDDALAWGPGLYVDTEAVAALGRTLKNAPTPLSVAGASFFRAGR
jgi:hypothetical protein